MNSLFSFRTFLANLIPSTTLVLQRRPQISNNLGRSTFHGEVGCFHYSCELRPHLDTRNGSHLDLVCHPLDDHPEFFLVMALLRLHASCPPSISILEVMETATMTKIPLHSDLKRRARPISEIRNRLVSSPPLPFPMSRLFQAQHCGRYRFSRSATPP